MTKLQLKPRTTYTDGRGSRVAIAGLARRADWPGAFWSIGGDHYTAAGEFISSRRKPGTPRDALALESFTQPDSPRNLVAEDDTAEARKWWVGVVTD